MKTYVVDIDGTIADLTHRLHFIQKEPKDWDGFFDACADDAPIENVIEVIRALPSSVVYVTGRPERVRIQTMDWLAANSLPNPWRIYMRNDGDHRPDTIAKRELIESLMASGHKIVGVFEDRPSVIRVWRSLGFTVFQVGSGEEF